PQVSPNRDMKTTASATLKLDDLDEAVPLFGSRDQYLRLIRDALEVRIIARGDTLQIEGGEEQVNMAERTFQQLRQMLRQQGQLSAEDVRTVLEVVQHGGEVDGPQGLARIEGMRAVRPRTDGQARYVRAIHDNDLTLCVGPGGTGKTYLAVAMAVSLLRQAHV